MTRRFFPYGIAFQVLTLFLLVSCVSAPVEKTGDEKAVTLPKKEQEKRAAETFNAMLEKTADARREDIIDDLEKGYLEVINEYPDTYLAEESYLRLMLFYLEEFEIPQLERAEHYYREYFKQYPKPSLGRAFNSYLARFYYNYRHWERLAVFSTPFMKQYVENGKLSDALYLYFYSEAKFQLEEYDEAERGFRLMIRDFPSKKESKFARKRVNDITHIKSKQQGE